MTTRSRPSAAFIALMLISGMVGGAAQQIQFQSGTRGFTLSQDGVTFTGGQTNLNGPPVRTGTSRISGRVLGVNGVPIRQATVRINAPQLGASRATVSDQDGRYEFRDIPGGRYTVSFTKAGFINLSYGQAKPDESPKPVVVADGQVVDGVNVTLPRGGVISGRVVDEFGEPVTDAQVMSLQRRFTQGQMMLMNNRSATTNDIGEFRLYGLMPGKYYVSVNVRNSAFGGPPGTTEVRLGYAPTYYPGTATAADAQPITVGLGETISGIEVGLTSTRLATISGSAIDSKGGMVRRGNVSVNTRDSAFSPGLPGASIQDDGTFTIVGVPPGEYVLRGSGPAGPPPNFAASVGSPADPRAELQRMAAQMPETLSAAVTVAGSDVSGVLLVPLRKITVAGRFTFDLAAGASLRASMMNISVRAIGSDAFGIGNLAMTQPVKDDFTFEVTAPASEIAIRPTVNHPAWVVKAVRVAGVDVTDIGVDLRNVINALDVEVELTNHPNELSGLVSDDRGQPIANATVVIFPEDRRRWLFETRLIQNVRSDLQGRYRVRTLPPGRYLAAAMEFNQANVQDPDVLEGLRTGATAVTLAEQESKTLNFTVAAGR